ncbi:MAG: hypothetical protein M1821_001876 [Bathelium mastoideum]|nr:MAG: hypothetical protein M1821_001876 [Bathelium mastoideum]
MTQGAVKHKASANPKRPAVLGPKRGAKIIKPKKAALAKQEKVKKKHSAGLTALTERNLAEKAGHLEMLAGGKKDKKLKDKGNSRTSKR